MCRTNLVAWATMLALAPSWAAAQTVNLGSTFHALEARARRITTTYPDAVVRVTRTEAEGMEAEVRRADGHVAARLRVPAGSRRVEWRPAVSGSAEDFSLPDQATVGLDWVAHQAYALDVDARAAAAAGRAMPLQGDDGLWDGHVRRNRRATRAVSSGALAARIQAVETHFDGLIVRAALDTHVRRPSPKRVDYSRFTATLIDPKTGASRGFVRWFDTAQVLTWKIDGGSQGVVLPERLRGGWTFTPTMAWANVQAYQFSTQAAARLEIADPFALRAPASSRPLMLLARAMAPAPTLALAFAQARSVPLVSDTLAGFGAWSMRGTGAARLNEPGCDNLHWLDGSIFRPCCDAHDQCYEKEGCTAGSWWWPFSGSWSCQRCNIAVVHCFCTVSNPMYCGAGSGGGSGGSGDGGSCTSAAGGFCPVECQSCQSR